MLERIFTPRIDTEQVFSKVKIIINSIILLNLFSQRKVFHSWHYLNFNPNFNICFYSIIKVFFPWINFYRSCGCFMWRFHELNLVWAQQRTLTPNPSWNSGVVPTLWQHWGWHCHNLVARSKMRVVATPVSKILTTSVFDVVKTLLQRQCNVATTLTVGILGHFTTNYSDSFPSITSSNKLRVTKLLRGTESKSCLLKELFTCNWQN